MNWDFPYTTAQHTFCLADTVFVGNILMGLDVVKNGRRLIVLWDQ